MDRYLRIVDYDQNDGVQSIAFQICKYQLINVKFLNYKPSMIAACIVIVAINIVKAQELEEDMDGQCNDNLKKREFDLSFWDTPNVI